MSRGVVWDLGDEGGAGEGDFPIPGWYYGRNDLEGIIASREGYTGWSLRLSSLENADSSGDGVGVWEVQSRCMTGNARVSLSAWDGLTSQPRRLVRGSGRAGVNVTGEVDCRKRGMGLIIRAGGPGGLGSRSERRSRAGCYSLSAREWSGFRMPFALSFCRRVPAVNCLTRYTDKE